VTEGGKVGRWGEGVGSWGREGRVQWFRIQIRIRIQHFKWTDPDTDPIRIPGFDDLTLKKKNQLKSVFIFFLIKNFNLLIQGQGLHTGLPGYRRSLQPWNENIQKLKNLIYWLLYFCGSFLSSWIRIQVPHWIRIQSGSTTVGEGVG
jgi:hypothetical protein